MTNSVKCVSCGHVDRAHDPVCKNGCGCYFTPPSRCPLGRLDHNTARGHKCDCVPGQIGIEELL